jgi:hypothetical protein
MANSRVNKNLQFIWGPPPTYGRHLYAEDRKVVYQITERAITISDISKLIATDIMPKGFFKFTKARHIKVFNSEGFRLTNMTLLEDRGTYYADTKFPKKYAVEENAEKPTPTRRVLRNGSGCITAED